MTEIHFSLVTSYEGINVNEEIKAQNVFYDWPCSKANLAQFHIQR
jgi:hypothetical protein